MDILHFYVILAAANQDEPCGLGWQSTKSTVRERMAHMYLNTHLSDVLFVVYENDVKQVFPAHKFALSIGSAVFDAMFKFDAAGHQVNIGGRSTCGKTIFKTFLLGKLKE